MSKNIVFLHIPKTAGQAIHNKLVELYGPDAVSPTRLNIQMPNYSLKALDRYSVFSGHIDWVNLDFVRGPKLVFTILRDPKERLASFYLYLKDKAEGLSEEELEKPGNRGMYLAKNLSIDDYFARMDLKERQFLDDHYDNFYTYYLAGRAYNARRPMNRHFGMDAAGRDRLLERALENSSMIDIIGTIDDLEGFSRKFSEATGRTVDFATEKLNVNTTAKASRFDTLMELDPAPRTVKRIEKFLELDNRLYERLKAERR